MYVTSIELENIKCFKQFKWHLEADENPAGWHVLLGDNGSGKSTFIRATAIALLGLPVAFMIRDDLSSWVTSLEEEGTIKVYVKTNSAYDSGSPQGIQSQYVKLTFYGDIPHSGDSETSTPLAKSIEHRELGWFSASYGPFRRFTGGNRDDDKLYISAPRLARHLTAFGEDKALTATLKWLLNLRFKQLESKEGNESQLLQNIFTFINQPEFLPNHVWMKEVNSDGVVFVDAAGLEIEINDLSDGYRSILSMTLELIRQLSLCYDTPDIFDEDGRTVTYPGVVFIDEIDVHLHPKWQRKIGGWLTTHFPKIQFIVTTHSVFVCQSAVNGSIWRLPNPGDEDDMGERMTGAALNRLLYGNVLEAFSSGAFGMDANRSDDAQEMLDRLAELNVKAMFEPLTAQEQAEQERLQGTFSTTPQIMANGNHA